MAKVFSYEMRIADGVIVSRAVFFARGWEHAQSLADLIPRPDSITVFNLHRHIQGSTMQYCDGCDGVGLMEGWNLRDGAPCPKCKGAAVLVVEPKARA